LRRFRRASTKESGIGDRPLFGILRGPLQIELFGDGEGLGRKVHIPPCGVLDLLVAAPGEQKELEDFRFLLIGCCQQFGDFFGLIGGDNLLRVLDPICLFERPRNFLVVEEDVEKIDPVRDRPGNVARPPEMGNVVEKIPPVNLFEILLRTNGGEGVQGASEAYRVFLAAVSARYSAMDSRRSVLAAG
jgi:hypothetical protein